VNLRYLLPMVMRGLPVPAEKRGYIAADAAREAHWRGTPFGRVNDPVGRPTERGLALIPLAQRHDRAEAYVSAFMHGVWAQGIDAGSDRGLRSIVQRAGLSWTDAQDALQDEGWRAVAERNRFATTRASAERALAEADLATLSTPRPEDVALAEARVASAEAALNKALADAALSRVLAPIGGTILRIYARPGDQVSSDGLLDIADLTAIDVVADVYETDIPRLTLGMAAEVIVPGETRRFPATLREIGLTVRRAAQANTDPVAAVDARSVEVRLTLGEEGRALLARRANMQVQVALRPPAAR
jgi:hypothetical protein